METNTKNERLTGALLLSALMVLASCFLGCAPQSVPNNNGAGFAVSTPSGASSEEAMTVSKARATPRTLEVKLQITSVDDLRVKVGQRVKAGDVLSDRKIERAPLEGMRKSLQIALDMIVHPRSAPLPRLVPAFYADAEAAIMRAEKAEQDARRKVETIDARIKELDRMATLPPSQRAIVREHETANREQLERDRTAFEGELKLSVAQLENARAARRSVEYMNAREIVMQQNGEAEKLQTTAKDEATLRAQIASLDYQIKLLGVVRVPFSGIVKRITWEGQENHDVNVSLAIVVDDPDAKRDDNKSK